MLRRCYSDFPLVERQASRLLRVVEKRIADRERIRNELTETISAEDIGRLRALKESEPLQEAWDKYTDTRQTLESTLPLLDDADPTMRALASAETNSLTTSLSEQLSTTLPALLLPPSPTSALSAVLELKSGVGGTEASLFLATLLRMYSRLPYLSSVLAKTELDGGALKDATLQLTGPGAYDTLRWESGVHRVQRIPATDANGRIHTSTVTVVVLPLSDGKVEEDTELYKMSDVKIDVMRARGAGGQHVNRTESAVRLTHLPTGITVSMQDQRSQHQNKRAAFNILYARLLDRKLEADVALRRATRNNLVSSADRSEKIRTYNYPQERVTDHRIGLTVRNLAAVLEGDGLSVFLDALKKDYEEGVMEDMLNNVD